MLDYWRSFGEVFSTAELRSRRPLLALAALSLGRKLVELVAAHDRFLVRLAELRGELGPIGVEQQPAQRVVVPLPRRLDGLGVV